MKIYVYPADMFGCGYYRLVWPAEQLQREGHNVVVVPPGERDGIVGEVGPDNKLRDVKIPNDTDVMVIQRPTHRNLPDMVSLLRDRGITVIIDIDDDLSRIDAQHPSFGQLHPQNEWQTEHSWRNCELACERASLVVVSSPTLLERYGRRGNGVVIENCVPAWYLDVPRFDSDVFGWAGTVQTHPNDIQVVGSAIQRLAQENMQFHIIGPDYAVQKVTGLRDGEYTFTGTVTLDQWPHRLAELGVGITPLADTKFNESKSWLKPLEMAALGVPAVMSPRAEYVRFMKKFGTGVTAAKPQHWYSKVKRLVQDGSYREEMSLAAREAVRDWTYEKQAWRWLEAWSGAYVAEHSTRTTRHPLFRT